MPSLLVQKVAVAVFAASQALPALASRSSSGILESYQDFRKRFGRAEQADHDAVSFETRLQHFQESVAEVRRHNTGRGNTWVAVVNRFADYTPSERRALLGYRRSASLASAEPPVGSFLETRQREVTVVDSIDWRSHVSAARHPVRDQGACGSCWAVAAVGALEMHAELNGHPTEPLSYEQLVDCVANPRSCGGTGGCGGATSELAFDYVSKRGLLGAARYSGGYQAGGENRYSCPDVGKMGSPAVRAGGFQRLPSNKLAPLLRHVASTGPAVVSVDAAPWATYGHGVFAECSRNATVNHAVLLVGFGHDTGLNMDYWLIRNSWSDAWGEEGHIRLQRHQADAGKEGFCGTDHDNQQGVGCKDDPKEVPVCGMCGILSDSSYPTDVAVPHKQQI